SLIVWRYLRETPEVKKRWIVLPMLLVASGVTTWAAFNWDLHDPYPRLVANLPAGSWKRVSDAFSSRLVARFPVGSPQQFLINELQREGFLPRSNAHVPIGE